MLSRAARLRLRDQQGGAAAQQARSAQTRGDLEHREGLKLTVEQLERAEAQRVAMTARTLEFFKTYDLLLAPATIVAPFPIENRYVAECAGHRFDNYVEGLAICYAIPLVCC